MRLGQAAGQYWKDQMFSDDQAMTTQWPHVRDSDTNRDPIIFAEELKAGSVLIPNLYSNACYPIFYTNSPAFPTVNTSQHSSQHQLLRIPPKVEQMTKFFELEVIHSWEPNAKVLAIHRRNKLLRIARVAAQKAEADVKAAEGKIHKHMAKVGWKDIPTHLKEKPMMAAKLKELHENKHIYIPWYTCPVVTCQTFVDRKPIKVASCKAYDQCGQCCVWSSQ
ncbi:hypothetical protein F5J12DRAFT_787360 [Pisolithus orientalis]|uniref:uncharacterized protein n=1 Tax=Pisolithus orientalis TaxID=936130 RepID=UPI002225265F|nr:uncharacterized protein F5J12DRAFT_787360 [Pisolithus orientalis]KAI5985688.1 hypothetical protein F5J12DRAFT_787360 [Pisolithus orientalis]